MTTTGRITNEPADIYHGEHDKPAFGSGAIKCWILDRELFYHRYVKQDEPRPDLGAAGILGNAVEERALDGVDNVVLSSYKTRCKGLVTEQEANPGKYVLTGSELDTVTNCVSSAEDNPTWQLLAGKGQSQVTYRVDMGPFYLQARIDYEIAAEAVPEAVQGALSLGECNRLLIDLKTTQALWGQYGFARSAMRSPLCYPIQQTLYQMVVAKVLGVDASRLPFRFFAVQKTGQGSRWYNFQDFSDAAAVKVASAVSDLKQYYAANLWDEFEQPCQPVLVEDNYLEWAGQ